MPVTMLQASRSAYGKNTPVLINENYTKIYQDDNVVAYTDFDPQRERPRNDQGNVIVAFKGTTMNVADLTSDFKAMQSDYTNSDRYKSDRESLSKIAKSFSPTSFNYFFTGHSLGGISAMQFIREYMQGVNRNQVPEWWHCPDNYIMCTPQNFDAPENSTRGIVFNSGFQPDVDFGDGELANVRKMYMSNDPLYNKNRDSVLTFLSSKWGSDFQKNVTQYPARCPYVPIDQTGCHMTQVECLAKCAKWEIDPIGGHYLENFDPYVRSTNSRRMTSHGTHGPNDCIFTRGGQSLQISHDASRYNALSTEGSGCLDHVDQGVGRHDDQTCIRRITQ